MQREITPFGRNDWAWDNGGEMRVSGFGMGRFEFGLIMGLGFRQVKRQKSKLHFSTSSHPRPIKTMQQRTCSSDSSSTFSSASTWKKDTYDAINTLHQ